MTGLPRNEFGPNLTFEDAAAAARALGIRQGDRVLEVGGASNAFARADVVCDLTFGSTGQRNGAPGTFTKGVRYVEAPVEGLPFGDHEFDFVICRQVLEHVADPVRAASELSRVAKRGLVEVPSRAGELVNGNPTHRWIVDLEGATLVFHPRPFIEHPFDNLFYGRLFQDASLRDRSEGRFRNLFNHQVLFEGRLPVRVADDAGPHFDYDDPVQAGRSHFSFARNCLQQGADPAYALSDAQLATRLLPGEPAPRLLLAAYQVRLLQLDEALATLDGMADNAAASWRRLIGMVRAGEPVDLRTLPVPDPLDPRTAAALHDDRPKASIVVPALSVEGLRAAVESALAQDYTDVEVVVAIPAAARGVEAELAHLAGVPRLRIVRVEGPANLASLVSRGLQASVGNVLGFAVPPDRLQCHHLDRVVAGLLATGADAAFGDRMLLDGGGVIAADLVPGDPATGTLSLSAFVVRSAAALDLGPLDAASDVAAQLWLGELAKRHRVFHLPSVTVEAAARPRGAAVLEAAQAQLRLRPLDLCRELVALHAANAALARQVADLEQRIAGGDALVTPRPDEAPDLSAVIVNYQCARYTLGLIDTLRRDRFEVEGRPGRLEITIVDNASRGDDVALLAAATGPGVRLIRNTENAGYALANNQGFRVSSGRWHLVINPDVRVPPGTLGGLIRAVETLPDAGLAGPLASMDEEGLVLLPPNELPDPWREAMIAVARMDAGPARYLARLRTRFAHRYWTAREPLDLDMLSGGCFLGRRSTFLEHGLFDGGYPLYYEDTDLFRRLRGRGLRLWFVPALRIVHFFSRSAITRLKAALLRHDVSARRYFETWFGEAGVRVHEQVKARADARGRDSRSPWAFEELVADAAPEIPVDAVPGAYVEIAGNPQFTLAAGMYPGRAGPFTLPRGFFVQLGPGNYWIRTVDPGTSDPIRTWRLTKTSHARDPA